MVSRNYTAPLFITTTVLSYISVIPSHINNRTDDIFLTNHSSQAHYPSLSDESWWQQKATNVLDTFPAFLSSCHSLFFCLFLASQVFLFGAYSESHIRKKTLLLEHLMERGMGLSDGVFGISRSFSQNAHTHTHGCWLSMFSNERSLDVLALKNSKVKCPAKRHLKLFKA